MVFPSGKGRRRARQTSPPSLLVGPTVWGFLGCFPWRMPPSGAEAKLLVMDVLLLNVLLPPPQLGSDAEPGVALAVTSPEMLHMDLGGKGRTEPPPSSIFPA